MQRFRPSSSVPIRSGKALTAEDAEKIRRDRGDEQPSKLYRVNSNVITTKGTKSHEGNGLQMNPFLFIWARSGSCFKNKLTTTVRAVKL